MPKALLEIPQLTEIEKREFWGRVAICGPDECWLWMGGRKKGGYGNVSYRGRAYGANRVALFISNPSFDYTKFSLHSCDNPPCCNPAHLFEGTVQDNAADMRIKGRAAKGDQNGARIHIQNMTRGERHYCAVLNADKVREIRSFVASGVAIRLIAEEFGVSAMAIRKVAQRKSWAHIA